VIAAEELLVEVTSDCSPIPSLAPILIPFLFVGRRLSKDRLADSSNVFSPSGRPPLATGSSLPPLAFARFLLSEVSPPLSVLLRWHDPWFVRLAI